MGIKENIIKKIEAKKAQRSRDAERRRVELAQERAANLEIRRKARAAALRERQKLEIERAVKKEKERISRPSFGQRLIGAGRIVGKIAERATRPPTRTPIRRATIKRSSRRNVPRRTTYKRQAPRRRAPRRASPISRPQGQQFNAFGIPIN